AVREMQAGDDSRPEPSPVAIPGAQARLDRILGREKWHQTGGSWISGAIYGANDGLAAVFGIVTGVCGATGGSSFVLTAGLAGAIASTLSIATGAFLAERSEAEVVAANVESERREIAEHPAEEKEDLSHFLVGAAKSLVTLRSWWAAGLEMSLAGVIVGGVLYAVGLAFPT